MITISKKCTFNCRGIERRKQIVQNYNLTLVSHNKLLNGQTKYSCAEMPLTDVYYTFQYKNKKDPNDIGAFYCGHHAAKDFLQLANIHSIPLFNPLSLNTASHYGANKNPNAQSAHATEWNPEAKELYEAINLLIICWNTPIYGALADIQQGLLNYREYKPYLNKIKTVNKIIGADSKKRTLIQMIDELRVANPNLKTYTFHNLNRILELEKIKSNFS